MWSFCVPGSYAHALDGLYRVAREGEGQVLCTGEDLGLQAGWAALCRTGHQGIWARCLASPLASPLACAEGLRRLFSGATMASSRGALVTVGQVGLLRGVGVGSACDL